MAVGETGRAPYFGTIIKRERSSLPEQLLPPQQLEMGGGEAVSLMLLCKSVDLMSELKIQNFDDTERSGIAVVMVTERESYASCHVLNRV